LRPDGLGWARFRGWSVLFEPRQHDGDRDAGSTPGSPEPDAPRSVPDRTLDSSSSPAGDRDFLALLERRAHETEARLRGAAPLLLPSRSYHVTVLDGLSDGLVKRIAPADKPELERVLAASAEARSPSERLAGGCADELRRLIEACSGGICFAFAGLSARGSALVAALEPEPASVERHARIVDRRRDLLRCLSERWSVDLGSEWRPHVTLGYWRDRKTATVGAERLGASDRDAGPQRLCFERARVYGFRDMTTFLPSP